jgi:NTP pyrophosphatase (non-canonical NTP hydrolase)
MEQRITTMREAQELLRSFAQRNNWRDVPNVDKFDHLHEELIEMSQHLRYKSEEERERFVKENSEIFRDGIGDMFFGLCRLANQLGVDIEDAFNMVRDEILAKYNHTGSENNIVRKKS